MGFEPTMTAYETIVLPLHYRAICRPWVGLEPNIVGSPQLAALLVLPVKLPQFFRVRLPSMRDPLVVCLAKNKPYWREPF